MNAFFSADELVDCGQDRVRNEIQKILRAAQIRFTDEQLAAATGISPRCIKSYRVEGREPSLGNALALLLVLGNGDLNRILNLIGYTARPLDEADAIHCGEVVARLMEHGTTIAKAAIDGRIDHTERPYCTLAADRIIETVLPLSSAGAAA